MNKALLKTVAIVIVVMIAAPRVPVLKDFL